MDKALLFKEFKEFKEVRLVFYIDQNMTWIIRFLDCAINLDFQRFGRKLHFRREEK